MSTNHFHSTLNPRIIFTSAFLFTFHSNGPQALKRIWFYSSLFWFTQNEFHPAATLVGGAMLICIRLTCLALHVTFVIDFNPVKCVNNFLKRCNKKKLYAIKDNFFLQGMAYGILGNLSPIVGIYMGFFPVLIYFLFGTSRHVSIGKYCCDISHGVTPLK